MQGTVQVASMDDRAVRVVCAFTVMVYTMDKGFMTIYGAVYLLSLFLAFGIVIRMRNTVEALG